MALVGFHRRPPLLLLASVIMLASCATSARVRSAEVSQDDLRLRLFVDSCNASSIETTVTDVGHRVELTVTVFPAGLLGGGYCLDIAIVALRRRSVAATSSTDRP